MQTILMPSPYGQATADNCYSRLMELYEINYLQLRKLIPQPEQIANTTIAKVTGQLDLHYRRLARGVYTDTIQLSYQFVANQQYEFQPDFLIRIYRDAQVAEAIPNTLIPYKSSQDSLAEKWQRNRYLYKWLGFLNNHGYVIKIVD